MKSNGFWFNVDYGDYNPDTYEDVLFQLKLMYEGYEEFYWDLVYSLQPYDLILFYKQVNEILNDHV